MLPAAFYYYVVLNVTLSSMLPLYIPIIIIFLTTHLIVKKKENRK